MKKIIFLIGVFGIVLAGFYKSNDAKAKQITENTVIKSETPAPDFVLSDAENKPFRLSENSNKTVILCILRKMSKKDTKYWLDKSQVWMRHLKDKYGDKIVLIGMKDMRGTPRFIPKSLVKSHLKKQPFRFLIDWKGKVCTKYPSKDLFTLYVVSPEMKIVYQISESYSDSIFTELCDNIQQLFEKRKQL